MTDSILVRASSLTGWADCPRRWAARHIADQVEAAGFALRRVPNNIGAKIGTAVHAGAASMLRHKIKHGDLPEKASQAVEVGIESLTDEMKDGAQLDDTTPTINIAEQQVQRMISIYHIIVAPHIKPVAVELEMTARFSPTLRITGHMDVAEDEEIHDTKTGVMQRPNHPQYGAYSLLRRSEGHTVNRFIEDYVPRGSAKKPQPEPVRTEYPVATCEQSARAVLRDIDRAVNAFAKTGDAWNFLPNPASMLCADRFCPAWGTDFCHAHRTK